MATWPAELPQDQFIGLTDQRRFVQLRSPPDVGPAKVRPLARDAVFRNVRVPLILTGAEKAIFEAFYRDDLEEGTLFFDWEDPVTDDTRIFRFRTPPNFELIVGGDTSERLWSATIELEFRNKIIGLIRVLQGHTDADLFGAAAVAGAFAVLAEGHADVDRFGQQAILEAPAFELFVSSLIETDAFGFPDVPRDILANGFAEIDLFGAHALFADALPPDSVLAATNLQDTSMQSPPQDLSDVGDDPGSPDGDWWTAVTDHEDTEARVGFPTPGANPAGAQTFRVLLRRTSGGDDPTVDLELWEDGQFLATLLSGDDVSSEMGVLKEVAWDPQLLADPSGADVELRIVGHATADADVLAPDGFADVDLFGEPAAEVTDILAPDGFADTDAFGAPEIVDLLEEVASTPNDQAVAAQNWDATVTIPSGNNRILLVIDASENGGSALISATIDPGGGDEEGLTTRQLTEGLNVLADSYLLEADLPSAGDYTLRSAWNVSDDGYRQFITLRNAVQAAPARGENSETSTDEIVVSVTKAGGGNFAVGSKVYAVVSDGDGSQAYTVTGDAAEVRESTAAVGGHRFVFAAGTLVVAKPTCTVTFTAAGAVNRQVATIVVVEPAS